MLWTDRFSRISMAVDDQRCGHRKIRKDGFSPMDSPGLVNACAINSRGLFTIHSTRGA